MSESVLLDVSKLKKSFAFAQGLFSGTSRLFAVNGVSFSVRSGETLGIVGESGCGKSTLARLILRLDDPDSGDIYFKDRNICTLSGEDMNRFRRQVQIVFQDPLSSLNPRKKIGSIIGEPMRIHRLAEKKDIHERVAGLMKKVGLQQNWINRYPHEFSSGQRQRIGIARALSLNPELIVADEPVSALDVSIQAQILNLMLDLQRDLKLTYIFISHDLSVVRFVSTRVAVMYLGVIVEMGSVDDIFTCPLHPYTEALLAASPVPDPQQRRRHVLLRGDVPEPVRLSPGCVFAGRCPIADQSICFDKRPALEVKGDSHMAACFLR